MDAERGDPEKDRDDNIAGQRKEDLMDQAIDLDGTTLKDSISRDTPYLAEIYNVKDYGVFCQLTAAWGSDITGLVHQTELPAMTRPGDYEPGDQIVVSVEEWGDDGLSLHGLFSPDVDAEIDLNRVFKSIMTLNGKLEQIQHRLADLETKVENSRMDLSGVDLEGTVALSPKNGDDR